MSTLNIAFVHIDTRRNFTEQSTFNQIVSGLSVFSTWLLLIYWRLYCAAWKRLRSLATRSACPMVRIASVGCTVATVGGVFRVYIYIHSCANSQPPCNLSLRKFHGHYLWPAGKLSNFWFNIPSAGNWAPRLPILDNNNLLLSWTIIFCIWELSFFGTLKTFLDGKLTSLFLCRSDLVASVAVA